MIVRLFTLGKPYGENDFFSHQDLVDLFTLILEEKRKCPSYQWSGIEITEKEIKSLGLFLDNSKLPDHIIELNKQFREMLAKYEFKAIALNGSCTPNGTVTGLFDVEILGNFVEIEFDENLKVTTDFLALKKSS